MSLAVLKYEFVSEKPVGIPDAWPAQIIEIVQGIEVPGSPWVIMSSQELVAHKAAHQAEYDIWENAYFATPQTVIIEDIILKAQAFGRGLIVQVARENIMMGITQYGKTRAVADYCEKVQGYLMNGSLYAAIEQLDAMIADTNKSSLAPFITNQRLTSCKNQIQDYVGMPRT